jgi:hypothetical protein
MGLLRIRAAIPLEGFCLRLTLTNGTTVERDLSPLLVGPVFEAVRSDRAVFCRVRVEDGTVVWPNGADLCPDVLIWGGPPPAEATDVTPTPPCDGAAF